MRWCSCGRRICGLTLTTCGFSKPHEIWRPGARAPANSGFGECKVCALWADPSQYIHQRADLADRPAKSQAASAMFFSPGRFPVLKDIQNPSPWACWLEFMWRALLQGSPAVAPPRETALGSLVNYICHAEARSFQPANITFDLLPQLSEGREAQGP